MRNVAVESIINRAKFRLGLQNTFEEDGYFELLAEEAIRGTLATDVFTVQCATVEIDCLSAKLPENYEEIIAFQLEPSGTCSGCCGQLLSTTTTETGVTGSCCCLGLYYYSRSAFMNFGVSNCGWYGNYFGVQNGFITFPSTVTATSVKIYYTGYNETDEGFMIYTEEQQRGLSAYIAWQYAKDKGNTGIYTRDQKNDWGDEWKAQKAELNGKRVVRDANSRKPEISAIMNSILYWNGMPNYRGGFSFR